MLAEILGHVSFNPATHPSEQVRHCLSAPGCGIFRTPRCAPTWIPHGQQGETGTGACSAFLAAPWQQEDWKQTLILSMIPASNAEHATCGKPTAMQQGSPALLAALNSSGNGSEECSDHKGSIPDPLPLCLPCLCSWKQVCITPASLLSTQPRPWHHTSQHNGSFPALLHGPSNPL